MHYILVKFDDNYGDEFDVHGFRVFTQESYVEWLDRVNKEFALAKKRDDKKAAEFVPKYKGHTYDKYSNSGVEMYFGSNEFLQWLNQEDFHTSVTTSLISEVEKDFLVKQFTESVESYGWGVFPDFDSYEEELED